MSNQLTVVYGETTLNVAAGTSLDSVKQSMSTIFPELKNADVVLEGTTIKFNVKAGTKGMADNQLVVKYGDTTLNVAAGTSLENIKASMSTIFPELKNAEATLVGSEVHFKVKAGTKGDGSQLVVKYGDTTLNVAAGTSLENIKASMSTIFPELKNAEATLVGSEVHFKVKAGTKGDGSQLVVKYGDTTLNVAAGTSLENIKASMSTIFPELKNAEATLVGSEVHFKVKAGTKGDGSQLTVKYGDTTLNVAAGTSLENIKASMSTIFPELKNAEATLVGTEVHFKVKAGTKGDGSQLVVKYGDTTLNVAAGTSLENIKASMSTIFPELKNAEATLVGSEVHFKVKAGTKGADQLTVKYGDTTLNVAAGTSLENVKASMSTIFPELKNAEATLVGNEIHFKVKAGTKGN